MKKNKKAKYIPQLGDKISVDGIPCTVRYINQGRGYLAPDRDDADFGTVRGLVIAYVLPSGEIRKV